MILTQADLTFLRAVVSQMLPSVATLLKPQEVNSGMGVSTTYVSVATGVPCAVFTQQGAEIGVMNSVQDVKYAKIVFMHDVIIKSNYRVVVSDKTYEVYDITAYEKMDAYLLALTTLVENP